MPWTSVVPILIWAVVMIPLTIWLWLKQPDNKLTAILVYLAYIPANIFAFAAINWSIVNYWLRLLPVLFMAALLIRFFVKVRFKPFLPKMTTVNIILIVVSLLVLPSTTFVDAHVLQSNNTKTYTGDPMLLLFPVRYGMYIVTNGGNSVDGVALSSHYNSIFKPEGPSGLSMAYGVDIMKSTIRGRVSKGVLPASKMDYEGWNEMVYSPCPGEVVYVEDGHPDVETLQPASSELGNYLVMNCNNVYITLANLKKGSIVVKQGDQLQMYVLVGNIGNSGMPSVPHLHVHATTGSWKEDGQPIPIFFNGLFAVDQFAIRNQIFIPQL